MDGRAAWSGRVKKRAVAEVLILEWRAPDVAMAGGVETMKTMRVVVVDAIESAITSS